MKEIYFGDKTIFAIRYIPKEKYIAEGGHVWYYGHLHLVINGQLIGSPDEWCSVTTWTHSMELELRGILEGRRRHTIFENRSDEEIFALVWKSNQFEEDFDPRFAHLPKPDRDVWYCHLSIDETTDAYLITITEHGEFLKFTWKGWRMPCPKELRGQLFSHMVRKDFVVTTIKECLEYVQNDLANYVEIPKEPVYAERTADGQNFVELLKSNKDNWSEITFVKIACGFARLAWEQLDQAGREGLIAAEQFCEGKVSPEQCAVHHKKLQDLLPEEEHSPYSPVLWALKESTPGSPAWWNAILGGMNIYDLKIGNNDDLCAVINKYAKNK